MNTTPTPHTPLETLLLFRGIAQYGLEAAAFASIAEALQNNQLVKNDSTYDATRLSAEALQELFLQLLWEELKTESESTPLPDGTLSPVSKKPKSQPSPPQTLRDARQHVEKIESAHRKLHDAYVRHAFDEIQQYERQLDQLHSEIIELEKAEVRGDADDELRPQSPNGVQDVAGKHDTGLVNGVGPSPKASPKPIPQQPIAQPAPQSLRPLQPLLPHPPPRQDARTGPSPPQQAAPERASPGPRSPAPPYPQVTRSPQLGQQDASRVPAARHPETPKPPNGTPQVLQAPQGAPTFQPQAPTPTPAEGLQPPESAGARQSPVPAQGQLKWEPPYQPNVPSPRQTTITSSQHQASSIYPPLPHILPSQRPAQQQPPPHSSPLPLQAQSGRPLPQQGLIPPHSTSQFAPPLQSSPVRAPAEVGGGPVPGRQQSLLPNAAASGVTQPQPPYHPPPYQGYPLSTPVHTSQVQAAQTTQGRASPVHPHKGRSPVAPPPSAPPATAPSRPGHGIAAPTQHRPQPPDLQAPPPYSQQPAPHAVHSPAPTGPDGPRVYHSPYQAPRTTAVDRIHPRLPVAATPTPPARFSPAPSAPQTPAMNLPQWLAKGSGTAWKSNSTPATPKQGFEVRLGHDDVPSPAFEPASPTLAPLSTNQRAAKAAQTAERPTETPGTKRKSGRSRTVEGVQDAGSMPTHTPSAQAKRASQAAAEPEPPRVKDEATTPRPSTETGDTTADESVPGRPRPPRPTKRKREDLTPTPVHTPRVSQLRDGLSEGPVSTDVPKLVLWTRSFNKVSGSAMEQIIHHRSANMFAAPIRDKDAPGYHKVVKHPQDLKTIRAAINHGNRAAAQAAAALPDGDPGTSSVWLPRTEELVPPKSIINSGQLDRELAHMFSNAIMYNPDPYHGPGPAFLRDVDRDDGQDGGAHQDNVLGYKVDEFGVVNDARAMFVEVEKLLSELRSAEIQRSAPPGGLATGTSTRQASVQGHGPESVKDEGDDGDEQTGTETETVGGAVKRRRVARN
ncbi:Bromo domain-containing protein [Madurella fahalii]|uniref:Bromo domain-containing protein n=1 Tax=Madurella fahalii TaxID=1157608 RepID=A0ABQ0G4U8_9PEZI